MKLTAFLLPVSLLCSALPAAQAAITPLSPDTCRAMTALGIITPENPVPCERLVNVDVRFITFEGETRTGTITVADIIAPETKALFDELYRLKFPLHSVQPIEAFGGDDEASMAANNTSAFNGRRQASQKAWSKHAYGMAIDINPQQNPYRFRDKNGRVTISPPQSAAALTNREAVLDGKMETVLPLVFSHGFLRWGGEWKNRWIISMRRSAVLPLSIIFCHCRWRRHRRNTAPMPPVTATVSVKAKPWTSNCAPGNVLKKCCADGCQCTRLLISNVSPASRITIFRKRKNASFGIRMVICRPRTIPATIAGRNSSAVIAISLFR